MLFFPVFMIGFKSRKNGEFQKNKEGMPEVMLLSVYSLHPHPTRQFRHGFAQLALCETRSMTNLQPHRPSRSPHFASSNSSAPSPPAGIGTRSTKKQHQSFTKNTLDDRLEDPQCSCTGPRAYNAFERVFGSQ